MRKSDIQLQSVVLKLRVRKFIMSFIGDVVLNAELKYTSSILKCVKTE